MPYGFVVAAIWIMSGHGIQEDVGAGVLAH